MLSLFFFDHIQTRVQLDGFQLFIVPKVRYDHINYSMPALVALAKVRRLSCHAPAPIALIPERCMGRAGARTACAS